MSTRPLDDLLALHELLPLAWSAAHRAGVFLRDERPDDLVVDTKSTATDVVSEMDRTAERMIAADLLGPRPTDGLLGEEGGERAGTSGVRWVVDPLDGTVNYLHHLPMWGVSIGAEVDGVTQVGVIVAPAFDAAYLAVRGGGAWRVSSGVGERLTGSHCSDLSKALVTTGFGYSAGRRRHQAQVVTELIPGIADIRRTGSAVIDFTWLASGRLDAYYEMGLNLWDMSAGALIAEEAGAIVTALHEGGDLTRCFVAAAPAIHAELRARLVELGADETDE